ncbi:hypothetical protein LINPERHAP1_LOCUS12706 [Linum perenne]
MTPLSSAKLHRKKLGKSSSYSRGIATSQAKQSMKEVCPLFFHEYASAGV